MSRDKQIEEMAKDLAKIQCNEKGCEDCEFYQFECDDLQYYTKIAELLTDKGYRKSSDVAREIFEEADKIFMANCLSLETYGAWLELKKKYTEGEG